MVAWCWTVTLEKTVLVRIWLPLQITPLLLPNEHENLSNLNKICDFWRNQKMLLQMNLILTSWWTWISPVDVQCLLAANSLISVIYVPYNRSHSFILSLNGTTMYMLRTYLKSVWAKTRVCEWKCGCYVYSRHSYQKVAMFQYQRWQKWYSHF